MEISDFGKIKRAKPKHRAEVSMQTGFPSPATHYLERTVDLSEVLVKNKEATFFVRIGGSAWEELGIFKNDVLIIDRSLDFVRGKLALVVKDGAFEVMKYPTKEEQQKMSLDAFELWGVITYVIHSL
ncbi:S24 family peptidase [Mesonia aestuariivivens]|uniref:Peptidase S24 n=1 Tax=Mesonia aestuariivivens TaxID=2796128 RepID=A0ABS6VZT8_9FLAO|nr:S24 family peptidase [Mesonia aestuariivivens]MBW2961115.1 peptidase S24 [Mesonia aestuariivivens]